MLNEEVQQLGGVIRLRSAAAGLQRDRAVEARKSGRAKRRSIWAHLHIHCGVGRESTGLAKIENVRPDDSGAAGTMNVVELWAIASVKIL